MAHCLRKLYHRYEWCEYFQLKIEFSDSYQLFDAATEKTDTAESELIIPGLYNTSTSHLMLYEIFPCHIGVCDKLQKYPLITDLMSPPP